MKKSPKSPIVLPNQMAIRFEVFIEKQEKKQRAMFNVASAMDMQAFEQLLFFHIGSGEPYTEIGHPLCGAVIHGFLKEVRNADLEQNSSESGGEHGQKESDSEGSQQQVQEKKISVVR